MKRRGIIDPAKNTKRGERSLNAIPSAQFALNPYSEQMINMFGMSRGFRERNSGHIQEEFTIPLSVSLPRRGPFVQPREFDAQNGRLNFVQPAVPSRLRAQIFAGLSVIPQTAHMGRKLFRVCNEHAAEIGRAHV